MSQLSRWPATSLLLVLSLVATFGKPYLNDPPIRADGAGYHLWTRALLERDLSFCNLAQLSGAPEVVGAISYKNEKRNICQNKYPPGLALLRLPLMAPFVEFSPVAFTISRGEHYVSLVTGWLALLLTIFFCLKTILLFSKDKLSADLAIFFGTFGTNLFHYATYDSSYTHAYSACLIAFLCWCFLKPPEMSQWLHWGLMFCSVGASFFLVLLRNTNGLLIGILLVGFVFFQLPNLKAKPIKKCFSALCGGMAGGLCQLAYNFYSTGQVSFSSYGSEGFILHRPMFYSVLFSRERGLFVYSPFMALCLLSALIPPKTKKLALFYFFVLTFFAGLYGFWHSWHLAAGFGHRGFVEIVPLAIILFGVSISYLEEHFRNRVLMIGALSTFITMKLMWGYWRLTFPFVGAAWIEYWRNIFITHPLLSLFLIFIFYSFLKNPLKKGG